MITGISLTGLTSVRTYNVVAQITPKTFLPGKWLNQKTTGTNRKCSSRAFQWMVMSVGFKFYIFSSIEGILRKIPKSECQWYHLKACLKSFTMSTNVEEVKARRNTYGSYLPWGTRPRPSDFLTSVFGHWRDRTRFLTFTVEGFWTSRIFIIFIFTLWWPK
jgi:hypothetical protein